MKVALALVFVGLLAVAAATEEEEFSLLKRLLLKALKKEANTKRSQGNGGAFSQMKKKTIAAIAASGEAPEERNIAAIAASGEAPEERNVGSNKKQAQGNGGAFSQKKRKIIVDIAASGEAPEERNIESGDATETQSKKMGVPSSVKDVEPAKQDRPSMGPGNKPANQDRPSMGPGNKPANQDRPSMGPGNKPANQDRPSMGPGNKPANQDRPSMGPGNKPANQDRPSVGSKEGGRPHMPKFDDEDGEMVAIPHPKDQRRGPPSIPLPVLAFVMGSRAFTAAPLDPADLSHGVEVFGETLKRVVSSLRQAASDVRQATSLANVVGKLQSDISSLGKTFIPAQRMATASFTRVMLYGLTNRVVCDLDAEDVDSCVAGRLALLAAIFEKPDHMDKEVDQMKRCNAFVSKFPNGDAMDVSEDIDCVADRVMKIMEFVDKMKQTTAEAQLTSLLNARPLPKLPVDMDRVENEVTKELTEEFRGIIGMGFKILHEVGNLVETL